MASLSNINGLFDVHSTGAILFSTSHGTSGQILRSNGNAAPTWVAASTVIGGPYLPLTGGTLIGPLSGTSATFSGAIKQSSRITLNTNGTIQWGSANDYGLLSWDTGYALIYGQSGKGIKFATNGNTLALTLDTSQNATFAGNVNLQADKYILIGTDSGDAFNPSSAIRIQDSSHAYVQMKVGNSSQGGVLIGNTTDDYLGGFTYSNSSESLVFKTANTDALTITGAGNATFTGNVTIPGAILGGSDGANGGIRIHSGGTKFFSVNSSNGATNGVMDVGAADAKFKDAYFAGDVFALRFDVGTTSTSIIQESNRMKFTNAIANDAGGFDFFTRNSSSTYINALTILGSGNVGIGETSPSAKLHVKSTANADVIFKLENTNTGTSAGAKIELIDDEGGSGSGAGSLRHSISSISQTVGNWIIGSGAAAGQLQFSTVDAFAMIIDEEQRVGIGTTTVYERFSVNGVVSIRAAYNDPNITVTSNGMTPQQSGSLEFNQGFAGTTTNGDTIVFTYEATSWKSWQFEYCISAAYGLAKGGCGGYTNQSMSAYYYVTTNQGSNVNVTSVVATNTGSNNQHVTITITGRFGIHPTLKMKYTQGGGDGYPRADRASLTFNS